jgi:magnesium-transporting ATPase (P-type)
VHYKNLIFSGTSVTSGAGKAVVLNTGMSTEFGHLAAVTINMSEELSPMQVEMSDAVKIISVIAVAIGTLIFLLSYFLVKVDLHTAFIFAIGMVVAFIPEGMLPLVTLSLARATLRMAKRGAIVKKLSAVETLGCTSVICSDKTGTITRNEVTVSMLWVGGPCLTVEGHGYAPVGRVLPDPTQPHSAHQLTLLLRGGLLCNNSKLHSGVAGKYAVLGDPTEGALIVAAKKGGLDPDSEEVVMPRLQLFAFTSERKRMTSVHRSSVDAQLWAFTKGAPTTVLDLCAAAMWGDAERPLIDADRRAVLEAKDRLASLGQRVLAVAVRRLPEAKDDGPADGAGAGAAALRVEDVERDMTLVGLVAMSDPPREGIAEAVATCHRAGVRVIMITGDDGLTAANIASRIGMSGPLGETEVPVVRGADLSAMTSEQLQQLLSEGGDVVFARVTPHEKLRIVTAFQETGAVVAVTGDGVNDAPALKKAHIGIAMGLGGTDVAKEASDIILTDNNFAAIVFAIEEGRAVYENIKKFLAYILVSNTAEAVPFVFFVATRGQFPLALTVMLVLAIDLATDMIPALALGADPPQPGTMDRPPRNIKETFFQPYLLIRALVYLGSFEALCSMFAFMFHLWTHGFDGQWLSLPSSGDTYREAVAFAFAAVVFAQVGTVWVVRSETTPMWRYNFFDNPLLWFGIAFELALLLAIIEVPGLNVVFETAPFPASPHIFILIGITVLMIVVGEVFKVWTVWIRRRRAAAAGESDADKLKKV